MSDTQRVLERARELIEQGWTTGTMAREANGSPCSYASPYAVRWCANGALWQAAIETPGPTGRHFVAAGKQLERTIPTYIQLISTWNDHNTRTAAEVLETFDLAIQAAQVESTSDA